MADKRAYFHLDVGYLQNPKIAPLVETNPRAILLHLQAIAYSAQHLTDGRVPMRLAMHLACAEQCDLQCTIENGLLYEVDERTIGVHDYLQHQRSSDQVKQASDKGKRAASARWQDATGNAPSNASGNASGNAKRERKKLLVADAPRADVEDLCELLATLIESNGSKRPTITRGWRDAARLMLDRDARPLDEARQLIQWSQGDAFWSSNVLSMPKFREQYDKLRLRSGVGRPDPGYRIEEDWS